jgi:transcription elongation factor GreB
MSRAFTKESDGELDPLPDLPLSPQPNYVTPRGFAALQARLLARQSDLTTLRARAERLDKLPEAACERDIRYLDARLRTAIVINPATLPLTEAAFGLRITVADAAGAQTSYEITGEDEAAAPLHRIAPHSPLARALIGGQVGDTVIWQKPSGPISLEILNIAHADPQP